MNTLEYIFITFVISCIVAIFLIKYMHNEPEYYHLELDEPDVGCIVKISVNGVEFEGYLSEDKSKWLCNEDGCNFELLSNSFPFWKYK